MRKVVFLVPRLSHGGAERVASLLANQMVLDGYAVDVVTILHGEELYPLDPHVRHLHIETKFRNRLLRKLERAYRVRKAIQACKADAAILLDRNYGIWCIHCGVRLIGSERNDPYSNMRTKFEKRLRDWFYRRMDAVVFQTEYAKGYFSRRIQNKGIVIANPVSASTSQPYAGERDKRIIAVCRLEKQKNLPMLLDAFDAFSRQYPDYRLEICGDGSLLGELQRYARQLASADRITFSGYVEDVRQRMRSAAMYVSSSDYEGISNAMLEALAMGVPTVCTDCPAGGAALAINSGTNGYLIPVGDAAALARTMLEIAGNPEKAQQMSKEATVIKERFSIGRICKAWESLI